MASFIPPIFPYLPSAPFLKALILVITLQPKHFAILRIYCKINLRISAFFNVIICIYYRKSAIVFDEVQECPRARQAIKHLVKDGRYDYIETGSLISIRKNVQSIVIPSEEMQLTLHPLDFEEYTKYLYKVLTLTFKLYQSN